MALVLDLVHPQELLGLTRQIHLEEERNHLLLSQYLPNRMIDEIEYSVVRGLLKDADSALVRSWDTEAPIGARQGLDKMMGELAPISKKMRLGEEERLRRRMIATGNATPIIEAIYDDVAQLTRSVLVRVERLRGEALEFAQITLNENGVQQTVPFGRQAPHTVTAGILWSNIATATPVADTRSWIQTYINTNGVAPAYILTSTAVITNLMRNQEIRQLAFGPTATTGLVTMDMVNAVFATYGFPPFIPYDTVVRVAGTQTRILSANKCIFMPPDDEPLGGTFFGTTAEALTLVAANAITQDQAPGLVSTVHTLDDPVSTWTKVAAVAFPALVNPDLTFVATVQ